MHLGQLNTKVIGTEIKEVGAAFQTYGVAALSAVRIRFTDGSYIVISGDISTLEYFENDLEGETLLKERE